MTTGRGRTVSRRAVLGAIGGAALAAATAGALARELLRSPGRRAPSLPVGVEGIPRIGYVYLATAPEEADAGRLRSLLADAGAPGLTGDEAELAALQPVAREETRRGDVVIVEGWVLSISEARAAALVAQTTSEVGS
jgi:hypothetical protein